MDPNGLRTEVLRRELPATAAYLGIDISAGAAGLADLTAVAIAQLAWRNGPVELWHRASPSRISDAEMMRANAATTRVVREHLPINVVAGFADVLGPLCAVLVEPGRRLPDGRTVWDLAAGTDDFRMYTAQVRAFFDRCLNLVERLGAYDVVGALACHAAAACWKWWLAPGWPSIVDAIMNSIQGRGQALLVACPTMPGELNPTRVRQTLYAGPDRLSVREARYCCCLASRVGQLPQAHGLSPRSRRLLAPVHRDLMSHLVSPVESFRQRQDQLSPISVLGLSSERRR